MSKRSRDASDAILRKLRPFGLAYPGAHTKRPWPGHDDLAVNDKTFAYLSAEGEPFSVSVKLPIRATRRSSCRSPNRPAMVSARAVWVTVEPAAGQMPSLELLKSWIDESYRAQAPKKLAAGAGTTQPKKTARSRRSRGDGGT